MTTGLFLYLLGWLCLAVGIACYNRRKQRGAELNSFDVVTLMVMAERKSSGMWRKNVEPYL